jgi:protein SCO1/2
MQFDRCRDRGRRVLAMIAVLTVLSLCASSMSAAAAPVRIAPDFTLSDQNGQPFTLSHYRGRPVVLFFGYTHCPDVCPTILANLKRARDVLGGKAHDVVVALVTVDPERDTAAELRQFVTVFDPSFLGLRGTRAQLEPIYRAYHVRYAKLAENSAGYLVSSGGTSKPSTQGHFKIGQLVAHRLELSSNHSRLNKGPRLAFSDQHTGLPR